MLEQFGWGRSRPTASGTLGLSSAWPGSWSNAWPNLKLVEINAHFLGKLGQAFSLEGFDGFGGDPQLNPTVAFGPPDAFALEVGLLEALGAAVGVGDGVGVVGTLAGELTATGHRCSPI